MNKHKLIQGCNLFAIHKSTHKQTKYKISCEFKIFKTFFIFNKSKNFYNNHKKVIKTQFFSPPNLDQVALMSENIVYRHKKWNYVLYECVSNNRG